MRSKTINVELSVFKSLNNNTTVVYKNIPPTGHFYLNSHLL